MGMIQAWSLFATHAYKARPLKSSFYPISQWAHISLQIHLTCLHHPKQRILDQYMDSDNVWCIAPHLWMDDDNSELWKSCNSHKTMRKRPMNFDMFLGLLPDRIPSTCYLNFIPVYCHPERSYYSIYFLLWNTAGKSGFSHAGFREIPCQAYRFLITTQYLPKKNIFFFLFSFILFIFK